jgi:DNA repair exonuclease SbcCD nuclease subunit
MSKGRRLLIYTDLQATEGSDRCFTDPSLPLQRYRVKSFFEKLEAIAETRNCDVLVDLGDTTDDRSYIPRATLDCMLSGLSRFSPNSLGIKLTGNHEQLIKYADVNSKALFQPYFGEIDPPTVAIRPGVEAVCHPFHEDYDQVNENIASRLAGLNAGSYKILLAHGDVRGVRYDSGEAVKDGIDPALVEKFDMALFGHVHRHQQIGKNAWYVGSPFQQDFGEAGQRKFVVILDCTGEPRLEWIQVEGMPEYRVVDLKDFLSQANPAEEHRYWVTLNSIEETEVFYASPKSVLGKAKLTYTAQLGSTKLEEVAQMTDRQLLDRYVATRPISGVPDELARDLAVIGEEFLR